MGLPEDLTTYVVFRLDGGRTIGSGHVVRCATIASELAALGVGSLVVVSTEESALMAEPRGLQVVVAGGDPINLGHDDAVALRSLMGSGCVTVVVDTYAAGDDFWDSFGRLSGELNKPTVLIDDRYLFSEGMLRVPKRRQVDLVVSYGFDADEDDYKKIYSGTSTRLLIGPRYAPVREGFEPQVTDCCNGVNRILVTSGSTNPGRVLERFCAACLAATSDAEIDLVVGATADVDLSSVLDRRVRVHRGLTDLAPLMACADLAVSAAGSTLYELSRMGVPTVTVPIVENQRGNARGFAGSGCGLTSDFEGLTSVVGKLVGDSSLRESLSARARSLVDGLGARRIAREILNLVLGDARF